MDLTSMMNEENETPSHVTQPPQPPPHHSAPLQPHLVSLNNSVAIAPVPVLDNKEVVKEVLQPVAPPPVETRPSSPPPLNAMGFPRYKSYKKKYKKMLIRFNSCMARSTEIFRDDLRARKIYSRIVRENMTLLGLMQRNRGEVKDSDVEEDIGDDKEEGEEDEADDELEATAHGLSVKLMEKATNDAYQSVRSEEVTELNPNSIGMWLKRNHSILTTEEDPQDEGRKRRKGQGGEENRKRTKRGSMSQGSS